MRTMILAAVVAAAVAGLSAGASAKADDEPTYALTVQLDNV